MTAKKTSNTNKSNPKTATTQNVVAEVSKASVDAKTRKASTRGSAKTRKKASAPSLDTVSESSVSAKPLPTRMGGVSKSAKASENAKQKKGRDIIFDKMKAPYIQWTEATDQVRRLNNKQAEIKTSDFQNDIYNIFVVTNTWCSIADDYRSSVTGTMIANRIRLIGLQAVISEADQAREKYTHQLPIEGFWSSIYVLGHREALTLLGFPKRIRLATLDHRADISGWLEENRRQAFYGVRHRGDDRFVSERQRETALSATPDHPFLMECLALEFGDIFNNYERDASLFVLPPGATYEGCSNYYEKLVEVFSHQDWLRQYGVNIPWWPMQLKHGVPDTNRLIVVPKNYKSGRFVCPEPVVRQVRGYQVSEGMYKCLRKFGIDTRNQDLNRDAIVSDGPCGISTIDLHAASDSLAVNFICQITKYTPTLYEDLYLSRSPFVLVNGQLIHNHHWMTMGNTCTFNLETGVFFAFVRYACRCAATGKRFSIKKFKNLLSRCHVYGDDIEVPDEVAPILIDLLTLMGFMVNESKTFYGELPYRESCGCETWDGADVTGLYWPRGTSEVPLAELIGMQHKLFDLPIANGFLTQLILDVFPKIKVAEPGSPYMDLWDYAAIDLPEQKPVGSPYAVRTYRFEVTYIEKTDENRRRLKLTSDWYSLRREYCGLYILEKEDPFTTDVAENIRRTLPSDWCVLSIKVQFVAFETKRPERDDYATHTVVTSRSTGSIPDACRPFVEFCSYYLTLGQAIEHINGSPFTKPQDNVRCLEDLFAPRLVYVTNIRELR